MQNAQCNVEISFTQKFILHIFYQKNFLKRYRVHNCNDWCTYSILIQTVTSILYSAVGCAELYECLMLLTHFLRYDLTCASNWKIPIYRGMCVQTATVCTGSSLLLFTSFDMRTSLQRYITIPSYYTWCPKRDGPERIPSWEIQLPEKVLPLRSKY